MGKKVIGPHEDLTYRIIGAALAVHSRLGPGHKEEVSQRALEAQSIEAGLAFEAQKMLEVYDNGVLVGYYIPDFIYEGKVIVEIKAFSFLASRYRGQVVTYLNHTGLQVGHLINFGERRLRVRRVFPSVQAAKYPVQYEWLFIPDWLRAERAAQPPGFSVPSVSRATTSPPASSVSRASTSPPASSVSRASTPPPTASVSGATTSPPTASVASVPSVSGASSPPASSVSRASTSSPTASVASVPSVSGATTSSPVASVASVASVSRASSPPTASVASVPSVSGAAMKSPLSARLLANLPLEGPVTDVRVGTHWTAVVIKTRHGLRAGLASTQIVHDLEHGRPAVRNAGHLIGMSASALAAWITAESPTERSIGFATLNALLEVDVAACVERNAEQIILEQGRGRRVAIIGHFPFVSRVREAAAMCWVLELNPLPGDLPAAQAPVILPQADVVAITGMSLVNGTFEGLVALCRPDAYVLVLGATTPLTPLLFEYGVNAISGTVVTDIPSVLAAVSQGANFRQIGGKRLLTMMRP